MVACAAAADYSGPTDETAFCGIGRVGRRGRLVEARAMMRAVGSGTRHAVEPNRKVRVVDQAALPLTCTRQ
jgi:hypothetical protein